MVILTSVKKLGNEYILKRVGIVKYLNNIIFFLQKWKYNYKRGNLVHIKDIMEIDVFRRI